MPPDASTDVTQPSEIDDRGRLRIAGAPREGKSRKAPGHSVLNGDSCECIVLNLSETGAQLELHGLAPNVSDLVVEGDRKRRSSFVVWRKAKRVGVKFQELW